MARPKKVKVEKVSAQVPTVLTETPLVEPIVVPTLIEKLAIDYSNEGLNNMAKKINEIIDAIQK